MQQNKNEERRRKRSVRLVRFDAELGLWWGSYFTQVHDQSVLTHGYVNAPEGMNPEDRVKATRNPERLVNGYPYLDFSSKVNCMRERLSDMLD